MVVSRTKRTCLNHLSHAIIALRAFQFLILDLHPGISELVLHILKHLLMVPRHVRHLLALLIDFLLLLLYQFLLVLQLLLEVI